MPLKPDQPYRRLQVTGPKGHWSEWSLVRRGTGPNGHWSEGALVRRVTGPKVMV